MLETVTAKPYVSRLDQWDRFASIRSRPRRHIVQESNEYYFPISRQPICVHPIITSLGDEAVRFILIQSMYKFMYEIAMLETEMVNKAACNVANNRLPFHFNAAICHDALTIIVDEAYHACVAIDFMNQVEKKTQIKPIEMPKYSPNTLAIEIVTAHLPKELHSSFELIAVCLSEHTLTKELISIGKEGKTLKSFSDVMADHVLDEGRHAGIFAEILAQFWAHFSEAEKQLIGSYLPLFIKEYLNTEQQITFDRKILAALSLSSIEIDTITAETHIEYKASELKNVNPVIPNLIKLLETTLVLSHPPTRDCFHSQNLI
ncbi:MAG: hypothetical protein A3F18_05480 [Legionellales bacterium RIFCSPHIGHO2_12_FULL_37_14]|nr:MAG: hypothetical protein A3F18_05480 [Legionellales bacterium RIFCSPHIGHO2_12_FULL_37_14]